ncbi:MAG: NAD-dependent epimerase/dehydratase family protein [SAR202 cluster bacterium]|nr:NAD-dependent epimerase/dehydratase family protein [SAR202 cluster bacterium]
MAEPSKVVAVTGASGYIGARLLKHLGEEKELERLVAVDIHPLPLPVHDVTVYTRDVTSPIDDALGHHQVTTLVHLAFTSRQGRSRKEVRDIRQANLKALHSVLNSCVRVKVNHVLYLSSHTVYGAHPDNPVPLTEDSPLRPLQNFPYGYDKYLCDQVLQTFAEQHPNVRVTILRPCVVLGPSADNDYTRGLLQPWLLAVKGHNPSFQFLHEDDLVRAMSVIIRLGLPGVFNVAGVGEVSYREMTEIIKSKLVDLPSALAAPAARIVRGLGMRRDSIASWPDLVRYPMVINSDKLEQATGYRPWYSSKEALTAFATAKGT